jgi:C1A family cysteine protease
VKQRKLRLCRSTVIVVLCALGFCVLSLDNSAASEEPQIAPVKPTLSQESPPGRGFIPPPFDLPHISLRVPDTPQPLAARFDWREAGVVTPVRQQGACGACYAFASLANFESRILIDGGGTFDFSENNLKECEWWGSSCYGGNYWRVASFLSTEGTVLEACDPYIHFNVDCTNGCPYIKTLLDWRVISYEDVPAPAVLKAYIETYGPLYTAVYAGNGDAWDAEFSTYDGTYTLCHAGSEEPNHAVVIVGWDDNLSHAGGQGAWIVKNSWGTSWGGTCGYGTEGGYFTIAYGSAEIGSYASYLYAWQDYNSAECVLHHDEAGFTSSVGYGKLTAYGMCAFVPDEDISVERVEFWTIDATTDVDIFIYDAFSGSSVSSLLSSTLNHPFENPGYHSVELPAPLDVASGNDIYVVVKLTDETYLYPFGYDSMGPKASGSSYLSSTGSYYSEWYAGDLGIRLRAARSETCGPLLEAPVIGAVEDIPADGGGQVRLTWMRSMYDQEDASPPIKAYKIWRRHDETPSRLAVLGSGGGRPLDKNAYEHGEEGPAWELVGTVPATYECTYTFDAPTLCDSSASGTCWHYFYVSAHPRSVGTHYDSEVEGGYSVDNLGTLSTEPAGRLTDAVLAQAGTAYLEAPGPNPGEGTFVIAYGLPKPDWVRLEVYDVMGRQVAVLSEGAVDAGRHIVTWNTEAEGRIRPTPGLYFIRLMTSSEAYTAKLVVAR